MLELITAFVFATLFLSVRLIRYLRYYYGNLEKLNIPVIKPQFIFGSGPYGYQKVMHEEDIKRMKEYGPII